MQRIGTVTLCAAAMLVMLVVAELITRALDGFPITSALLPPYSKRVIRAAMRKRALAPLAATWGVPPDVDPAWIDEPPAPIRRPADPDLLALRALPRPPQVPEYQLYQVYNARWIDEFACTTYTTIRLLPMPIQVFDPPEPSARPPYRHLAGRTTPFGFTTNQFGFRGADIPLDKPPGTVRIAFAGASTTVGNGADPFSYPECVIHWLNRWAERTGQAVRFDGINAGRGGITSTDTAAIVRDEVLPLEPDLVVYYEGANQFVFAAPLTDTGQEASRWARGKPPATWERFSARTAPYSALVQRMDQAMRTLAARGGHEPAKPAYELRWPANVDEAAPDLSRADLPLALPTILDDLERMRTTIERHGSEFAIGSFMILVADGLRLDPVRHAFIYSWLNQLCWPYRYRDLRRFMDFQNHPFQGVRPRYSATPGLGGGGWGGMRWWRGSSSGVR